MDVEDAVSGLMSLMESDGVSWEKSYNMGAKNAYSIQEIALCVCETVSERSQMQIKCIYENSDGYSNSTLDSSRFYNDFSWQPTISLKSTVRRIMEYEDIT